MFFFGLVVKKKAYLQRGRMLLRSVLTYIWWALVVGRVQSDDDINKIRIKAENSFSKGDHDEVWNLKRVEFVGLKVDPRRFNGIQS